MSDETSSPHHYTRGGIECIDAIGSMLEGYRALPPIASFCAANAIKYIWRAPLKHGDPIGDIDKAIDYLERLRAYLQEDK